MNKINELIEIMTKNMKFDLDEIYMKRRIKSLKTLSIETEYEIVPEDELRKYQREITTLEHIRTIVAETPMPMPFIAAVVTARVGQVPSTKRRTGFSFTRPFVKVLKYLLSFICGTSF